jgi:hypothetical protein
MLIWEIFICVDYYFVFVCATDCSFKASDSQTVSLKIYLFFIKKAKIVLMMKSIKSTYCTVDFFLLKLILHSIQLNNFPLKVMVQSIITV